MGNYNWKVLAFLRWRIKERGSLLFWQRHWQRVYLRSLRWCRIQRWRLQWTPIIVEWWYHGCPSQHSKSIAQGSLGKMWRTAFSLSDLHDDEGIGVAKSKQRIGSSVSSLCRCLAYLYSSSYP